MEKIVGHILANATSKEFESGKQVVNFTIVENRTVPTGEGKSKEFTRFFECSYWLSVGVAPYLYKGRLVTIEGTIGARAYINTHTGDPVAALTLTAQHIQLYGPNKKNDEQANSNAEPQTAPF